MRHIKKRTLISLILCIAVLMSSALLLTSCGDGSDKLIYELNEGGTGYIVTGCEKKRPSKVIIPEEYNGLPVTEIAAEAFKSNGGWSLKTLVIPDSVTKIGEKAFLNTNIESLTISKNLQYVGDSAFGGCGNMADFELPETLTHVGRGAFGTYSGSAFFEIEDGVTYFDGWVVAVDDSVTKITFREGTVGVAAEVFSQNNNLTEVTFSEEMQYICYKAFYQCENLTAVNSSGSCHLKSIEGAAFSGCANLSFFDVSSVEYIKDGSAFFGCSKLKDVPTATN